LATVWLGVKVGGSLTAIQTSRGDKSGSKIAVKKSQNLSISIYRP